MVENKDKVESAGMFSLVLLLIYRVISVGIILKLAWDWFFLESVNYFLSYTQAMVIFLVAMLIFNNIGNRVASTVLMNTATSISWIIGPWVYLLILYIIKSVRYLI